MRRLTPAVKLVLLTAAALFATFSGQVRKTGQVRVFLHCALDLDDGGCECVVTLDGDGTQPPSHPSGKADDLRLEPDGSRLYLQPRHRAEFAKGTVSEAGLSGCVTAPYVKGRLRVDGLPMGIHICVRTNQGRHAELRMDEAVRAGADHVLLSYTTWER
jgi:hypothetical protein